MPPCQPSPRATPPHPTSLTHWGRAQGAGSATAVGAGALRPALPCSAGAAAAGAAGVGPVALGALRAGGGHPAEERPAPGTLCAAGDRGGIDLRQFVLLPSLEEGPVLLVCACRRGSVGVRTFCARFCREDARVCRVYVFPIAYVCLYI